MTDCDNEELAFHFGMYGFDLPEFDTFLAEREWKSEKGKALLAKLLGYREKAWQAVINNDWDRFEEHGDYLSLIRHTFRYDAFMKPLAIIGDKVKKGGGKGGLIRGEQLSLEKAEKEKALNQNTDLSRKRGSVKKIVSSLALKTDELGDYLSIKDELWPELFGDLDNLHLNPNEALDGINNPLRIDYIYGDGKPGIITFASFQTMIYKARKSN